MIRMRVLALLILTVLFLAGAPATARDDHLRYLALGDSVAFGFDPLVFDRSDPENFVGYPEALAAFLDVEVTMRPVPARLAVASFR